MRALKLFLAAAVLVTAGLSPVGASATTARSGPFSLVDAQASAFVLPSDVVQAWAAVAADGTTQTRYQQMVGSAAVLGGQLTVIRQGGATLAVIGAHYPGLAAKNKPALSAADARAVAQQRIGAEGRWIVSLAIDPADAHLFYTVENRRAGERSIQWIDAGDGRVRNAYDGLTTDGPGIGVKGDTKQLDTSVQGGTNVLVTTDGRQATYDLKNRPTVPGTLFSDADDVWDLAGRTSPGQPAGVDAHYYAGVTDRFYLDVFSRDSLDDAGMQMVSNAHYRRNYNNAFWDGSQITFGDGDGTTFREFSGALDVVTHELTHGVTEFTSGLVYQNESGALNESFSDIMGNTSEYFADAAGLDPAATPDWLVGEDIYLPADDEPGIRNMADPQEDADPDHYSERFLGTEDNGGVHSNSGISNHAYALLVNGGRNAGCDTVGSGGHTHTANCDVVVEAIGLSAAQEIFYLGFTSLQETANLCDARNATVAAAAAKYRAHVSDAWEAVGVLAGCTPAPPPPPCGDADASIPFESDHPYSNNQDCTWSYDNGTGGFALHFSLLDVERNFDYVIVTDGNGAEVATYTGAYGRGATTPCIATSTANVRLVTDGSVTRRGFIVDAATAC